MRFLRHDDLKEKGVNYTRPHIWRLVRAGRFPAPVKGLGVENCWAEDQIDKYIADRVAAAGARDTVAA